MLGGFVPEDLGLPQSHVADSVHQQSNRERYLLVAHPRREESDLARCRQRPDSRRCSGQPQQPRKIDTRGVGVAVLDPATVVAKIDDRCDRIHDTRDVLGRIDDRESRRYPLGDKAIVQRDLLRAAQEIIGRRDDHGDRDGHEVENVASLEAPRAVARRDRVEIDERPEDPRHVIRHAEEMRKDSNQSGRVVNARGQIDRERRDERGEQAFGCLVVPLRDDDAGEKKTLQSTDGGGELDPVERKTRHGRKTYSATASQANQLLPYRPNPTFIENPCKRAALYSAARRALDNCSSAPTVACAPTTFSLSRFTAFVFSCERARYPDTPAYGEIVAQRDSATLRLATKSAPYTEKSRSSGPYIFTKLVRAEAFHLLVSPPTRPRWICAP